MVNYSTEKSKNMTEWVILSEQRNFMIIVNGQLKTSEMERVSLFGLGPEVLKVIGSASIPVFLPIREQSTRIRPISELSTTMTPTMSTHLPSKENTSSTTIRSG